MQVFAYCAQSFARDVRRAAGVQPLTCPPVFADGLDEDLLSGHEFVYFQLHGVPGEPYWYGDGWVTAINDGQLAAVGNATVFANCCYLPEGPMLAAMLKAGATVVGGPGENYAGGGALGLWLRIFLAAGVGLRAALTAAKGMLRLLYHGPVLEDVLQYRVWTAEDL